MCSVTHLATTPRGECRATLHGKSAGDSERIPLGMPFPLVIIPRPRVGQPPDAEWLAASCEQP